MDNPRDTGAAETAHTKVPAVWISIADQLPDDDMTVLIADTDGYVTTGFLVAETWRYACSECVTDAITHWAELPDPPNVHVDASAD